MHQELFSGLLELHRMIRVDKFRAPVQFRKSFKKSGECSGKDVGLYILITHLVLQIAP